MHVYVQVLFVFHPSANSCKFTHMQRLVHLNGRQQVFWADSRSPPAELKVASELSDQNPVGTLYEFKLSSF